VISSIRCGGKYFCNEISKNYNLTFIHEPNSIEKTFKNNTIVKLLNYGPFLDYEEIKSYSKSFDKVFILDRKNKEEQLQAVFYLYEISQNMDISYVWDDSMFEKKDIKRSKKYYSEWINRQSNRLKVISEVLGEDIIYYEDLYYQTDKVDLKGLKFVPDLKKKLRKKSEKKLV
jgi:hypothetical protein